MATDSRPQPYNTLDSAGLATARNQRAEISKLNDLLVSLGLIEANQGSSTVINGINTSNVQDEQLRRLAELTYLQIKANYLNELDRRGFELR